MSYQHEIVGDTFYWRTLYSAHWVFRPTKNNVTNDTGCYKKCS